MMTREEAPRESTGGPELQGWHYLQTSSSWILRPIVLSFSYADDRTALKLRNIACNPSDLAYCSASFHSSSTLIQLPAMTSSNGSAHKLLHLPAVLGGKPATKRQLPWTLLFAFLCCMFSCQFLTALVEEKGSENLPLKTHTNLELACCKHKLSEISKKQNKTKQNNRLVSHIMALPRTKWHP